MDNQYPYNGFYPGDRDPLVGILAAVFAAIILVAVLLTAFSASAQVPGRCHSVAEVMSSMGDDDSDMTDAEHVTGPAAQAIADWHWPGTPVVVSDVVLATAPEWDEYRVIVFVAGCGYRHEDFPKPGKKPADPAA